MKDFSIKIDIRPFEVTHFLRPEAGGINKTKENTIL